MTGHNASQPCRPHPSKYILILSYHLYPHNLRGLFPSGFHIKTDTACYITWPSHSLALITLMTFMDA
jgi:hypothetical protein